LPGFLFLSLLNVLYSNKGMVRSHVYMVFDLIPIEFTIRRACATQNKLVNPNRLHAFDMLNLENQAKNKGAFSGNTENRGLFARRISLLMVYLEFK
jgi:hypothetical protein